MKNYYRFEQQFFAYFENLKRNIGAMPLYLGTGSGAGATITGQLPQIRVSYDYEELATNTTSGAPSLLDNLNHIRYNIETLQDAYLSGAGLSGGGGLTQGHIIYDKDVEFTQRDKLVLSGAGVTVVDDPSNDATRVEIESILSFPELTDTPDGPYVTESGKYVKINSDGTAIDYGTPPVWGRNILRLDGGGEVTEQYDSNEAGLRSALGDSADGDVILIPPKTIIIANDGVTANGTGALVVPDGVCIKGMSREKTIISANLSTATASDRCLVYMEGTSYLDNLTVNYTRSTDAGDDAYAIYRKVSLGVNTGVSFANVTVVATGVRVNGVHAQIYNDSNKIHVAVDNCCFMVYGGAGSLNKLRGHSSTNREPVIIRNSVFYTDDSSVESGTTSASIYGLLIESNIVTNKIILQDCRYYSHITDPFDEYTTTISYGLTGSGFNYDLNSCTAIAINDSNCNQAGAFAISITNQDALKGKILNCVGLATGNSTLIANETTDYVTYPTCGLSPGSSIVEGGYFEGIDNNAGRALGISLGTEDAYLYNTVAKGDNGDIYIYDNDNTYLYSCQYDTLVKHSTPPTGSQTVEYLKGDRGTYIVEEFHASDIEDNALTRHLPLPSIPGYIVVASGGEWVLDSGDSIGSGAGAGANDKVKVSANDTLEAYLINKFVAGSGIVLSELDDGSFETLEVATGDRDNKIIRYDAGGNRSELYDATEAGLTSALADSSAGDIVLLPPQTITWTTDGTYTPLTGNITVPVGVTLKGRSREYSKIVATIASADASTRVLMYVNDGGHLENLTIDYNRTNATPALCVHHNYGAVKDTGITLKDVTIIAESTDDMSGLVCQVRAYEDRDNIAIDNCSITVIGSDAENLIATYNSTHWDHRIIIKDSTFICTDDTERATNYLYGLYLAGSGDNRVVVDNCYMYAEIKTATTGRSRVYGIYGGGNVEIKNTIAIARNPGTYVQTETIGIEIWADAYPYYGNDDEITDLILIENCIGQAISESTATSQTYMTAGFSGSDVVILNSYFTAECGGSSNQVFGAYVYSDVYECKLRNSTFQGNTYDLYVYVSEDISIYGCQYDTIYEPNGLAIILRDRRAILIIDDTITLDNTYDIVLCSGEGFVINLPTAVERSGLTFTFKRIDSISGVITISGYNNETIDDELYYELSNQYDKVTIVSNDIEWFIIG